MPPCKPPGSHGECGGRGRREGGDSGDLTCSVCHELFLQPKLLPCGHLLCRHCLLGWLASHHTAVCPLCRHAILEGQPGSGTEEGRGRGWRQVGGVVDALPSDLSMAHLVRVHRLLKEEHTCCMCEAAPSSSLCLTCGDLFCETCSRFHLKQSVARHHKLQELSGLTPDLMAATLTPATCAVHPDKPAELFCPAHDVTVCHVCATSRHRGCLEVQDVGQRVEGARGVLRGVMAALSEGESRLDRALQQLDDHVDRTEKDGQLSLQQLHDLRQRLDDTLTAWQQRVHSLTHAACSDVREAAAEAKTCLLQRRGRLTSHKHVVQRVQENKDGGTVTGMAPVMKSRVEQLDCSALLPATAKVISKVTVMVDQEAVARIERDVLALCEVKVARASLEVQTKPETIMLVFHKNCGKNIVLSNGGQTAERKGSAIDEGIVVASQPMESSVLYEICLDKRGVCNGQYMWTGVTTAAPDTLTLPCTAAGWLSAIVIAGKRVQRNNKTFVSSVGQRLVNLPVKSRVGVLVDDKRCLHLYINGVDQGVAAPNLPDTCFPFFDVFGSHRQITALPVTHMT